MKIKSIKRIGLVSSSVIGFLMTLVYVFSVVGFNALIAYHRYALLGGDANWMGGIDREQKLSVLEVSRVLSFVLIGFGLILKIVAFILFKKNKDDKEIATTLIWIKAVGIVLKLMGIIVLIPVIVYLGYTDANIIIKLTGNILFIIAQGSVIWLGAMFLVRLKRKTGNDEDAEEDAEKAIKL